jgi:hypothetical protein
MPCVHKNDREDFEAAARPVSMRTKRTPFEAIKAFRAKIAAGEC